MKKILSAMVLTGMFVSSISVSAQTTDTASLNAQIQALLDQIKTLQSQLETLKTARGQVENAAQDVKSTLSLIRNLRQGMTGDDVKTLQAILASDPDVYPEGLITGFFGPMTARAVVKFQAKSGIEQVGEVGPKTRAQINKKLSESSLAQENVGGETRPCVPPGHLIAPGWLRKNNQNEIVVPECLTKLPPGIAKKIPGTTSGSDNTAPVISSVSVSEITTSGAKISWNTNESSTGTVWYSQTSSVSTSTASNKSSGSYSLSRSVVLTGLSADTTYYFRVSSKDMSGNETFSSESSFKTLAVSDTIAPNISALSSMSVSSTSAQIVWTTNEPATSKIFYSSSTPLVISSDTPMVSSGSLVTSHNLPLSGLTPSTTYRLVAVSSDSSGNTATSSELLFLTLSE